MSCITEILKVKGNKEFLLNGQIAIEGGGIYKGYEYLIIFIKMGHRCGYVAISNNHPLCNFDKIYDFPDLDVHGGVTFFKEPRFENLTGGHKCTDKWIGFDCGHCWDIPDKESYVKYFNDTENSYINDYEEEHAEPTARIRTFKYVEKECKYLIDQLQFIEKAV